jgi:hypothetical protein
MRFFKKSAQKQKKVRQKSSASFNLKAAQKRQKCCLSFEHFFLDLLNSEKRAS